MFFHQRNYGNYQRVFIIEIGQGVFCIFFLGFILNTIQSLLALKNTTKKLENKFFFIKNKEISCFPASIIDEINEGIQTNTNTIKMESSSSGSYYCNTYPIATAPGIVSVTDRTPPSSMVVSSGYSKFLGLNSKP